MATLFEGGSPEEVSQAVALTLQGMLGLICDPVGGLATTPTGQRIAEAAGMPELVELQRRGRTRGERSPRLGPG